MMDDNSVEQSVEFFAGEPKYSEKTCPSAALFTTNPTWPDAGSNQGRRAKKTATNLLSYNMTSFTTYYTIIAIVGLERGPLILVSTIEELLDRKVAAPV
jgi:hypothetical protein